MIRRYVIRSRRNRPASYISAAAILALLAAPALAQQPVCGERKVIVAALADKFGETRRSLGVQQGNSVIEVFASETGSWTILLTNIAGRSCLLAVGDAFQQEPEPVKGEAL